MYVASVEVGAQLVGVGSSFHHVSRELNSDHQDWRQSQKAYCSLYYSPESSIYKATAYSTLLSNQCCPTMS